MLSEGNVGVEALPPNRRWSRKNYLDERQIAERLRDYIKRGVGAYRQ